MCADPHPGGPCIMINSPPCPPPNNSGESYSPSVACYCASTTQRIINPISGLVLRTYDMDPYQRHTRNLLSGARAVDRPHVGPCHTRAYLQPRGAPSREMMFPRGTSWRMSAIFPRDRRPCHKIDHVPAYDALAMNMWPLLQWHTLAPEMVHVSHMYALATNV